MYLNEELYIFSPLQVRTVLSLPKIHIIVFIFMRTSKIMPSPARQTKSSCIITKCLITRKFTERMEYNVIDTHQSGNKHLYTLSLESLQRHVFTKDNKNRMSKLK
jgi:hypothetical protein